MNKIVAPTLIAAAIAAVTLSAPVQAQTEHDWYLGVGAGQTTIQKIKRHATINYGHKRDSVGYFGGYNFNQYFGVEGGYTHLANSIVDNKKYRMDGLYLSGIGRFPLAWGFSLFAEAGAMRTSVSNSVNDSNTSKFSPVYGGGVAYQVSDLIDLQARFRRITGIGNATTWKTDVNYYGLDLVFHPSRVSYTAPTPVPVAANPAPQGDYETVSAEQSIYFGFDSATLTPDAQGKLKLIADFAKANQGTQILLSGYADAIGASDYNQMLSLRRAEMAKKYLVQQGVDAKQIKAQSYGEKASKGSTMADRKMDRRVDAKAEASIQVMMK